MIILFFIILCILAITIAVFLAGALFEDKMRYDTFNKFCDVCAMIILGCICMAIIIIFVMGIKEMINGGLI